MASRIVNCHDASVNGDQNLDQDIMKSLRNNFLPVTLTPQFLLDNSGSKINRYPDDNPLWGEVAKRYQQIVEKEHKLLNTCTLYCDGQTVPQNIPRSLTDSTSSILNRDTNFKDQQYKECSKRTATKCKSAAEQIVSSDIVTRERSCTSNIKEIKDPTFPKIVEVYSLTFPKTQAKETVNRKRKCQQGVSSCIEEKTWKDRTSDKNPPMSGFCPKKPRADIFIDLTVDEGEETTLCSSEDTNVNGNYQPERELVKLKDDTADNEIECVVTKSNTSKRKRVFPRRKKTKKNTPTMQKRRENEEMTTNKNKSSHEDSQVEPYNGVDLEINKSSGNGYEIDQNNNKATRKNGDSLSVLLDMSCRDHKITDLKAKLAQQEEELAKLKTLKGYVTAVEKIPQTPLNNESVVQSKQTENTKLALDNQKREEHIPTPGTVNLDDICQHVIKSFNIFNARLCKDNQIEKEGVNGRQISTKKNSDSLHGTVNGFIGHGRGNKQDEFLFQIGLKRKAFT